MALSIDPAIHDPVYLDPNARFAQTHAVCRAAYDMTVPQKRLLNVALKALLVKPNESLEVTITFTAVLKQFGLEDGRQNYLHLRSNVASMAGMLVCVDTIREEGFIPWFSGVWIAKDKSYVRFRFNELIRPFIIEIKKDYALIDTKDQGKLRGLYAIRLYEFIKSQEGNEGKYGNAPGEWFYYVKIKDLREMFAVGTKYKETNDFRKFVVSAPCAEINNARIGIHITPEPIYQGRKLNAIKFNCKRILENDPIPCTPTKEETEQEKRRAEYPEKWTALINSEYSQLELTTGEYEFNKHLKATLNAQKIFDKWYASQKHKT